MKYRVTSPLWILFRIGPERRRKAGMPTGVYYGPPIWQLSFDGTSNQNGYGIGILLIAPGEAHIPLAFKLNFEVTNNEAEYEACISGMEANWE